MYYKRNNKRLSVSGRGDYMSTSDFIVEYCTNLDACRKFFFDIKWPTGYYCEKMWLYPLLFYQNQELLSLC